MGEPNYTQGAQKGDGSRRAGLGIRTCSEEMVVGGARGQEKFFHLGPQGHKLARFRLDQGDARLRVARAEADETTMDEMGGSDQKVRCGERRGRVDRHDRRQGGLDFYGAYFRDMVCEHCLTVSVVFPTGVSFYGRRRG